MRSPIAIALALSLAACSSLTPIDDPVYLRLTDVEARLLRIERVLENESLITLATEIQSLRNEVQSLLGEVETMRFEAENQANRQRDLYVDLDRRLAAIEEAQRNASQFVAQGGGGGQVPVNDQQAYDAAYQLILDQRYQDAEAAFANFLASYPASELRDNAQYWLAE
ncbi:MAG: YbgF trimerization domain-containing protein, partial [Gammaproteobacteria bacterium]|nr:YbgF trimerization domain-containing protein [Gammaproteobacteria bacterium]